MFPIKWLCSFFCLWTFRNSPGECKCLEKIFTYVEGFCYSTDILCTHRVDSLADCGMLSLISETCVGFKYRPGNDNQSNCVNYKQMENCREAVPTGSENSNWKFYKTVHNNQLAIKPRSCLDHLKRGYGCDGNYTIYNPDTNHPITVYCDMTSEPRSAWTLVMSYAFKNKGLKQFGSNGAMENDEPVNEHSPNWNLYRVNLTQMNHLKSQSTHWRATCSFPTHKVDYTDYVRAKFTDFDIMTFRGSGICKKVEYINVRGHQCAQCTSKWWQYKKALALDSSATGCQFLPNQGSVNSEDNFGWYKYSNNQFRCSAGPLSTTNWWFGGYL